MYGYAAGGSGNAAGRLNTRLISAGRVPLAQAARPAEAVEMMRVVIFALGDTRYAVDIRYVHEIARRADFTPVPGLPGWVLGVMNLHGEIVSVVDLAAFLKVKLPAAPHAPDMLIVAQAGDQKLALWSTVLNLFILFPPIRCARCPCAVNWDWFLFCAEPSSATAT
jgi:hypothetical protein